MFVNSSLTGKNLVVILARKMQFPHAINDHFLDHEPMRGAIDDSLLAEENKARARESKIVFVTALLDIQADR